MVFKIFSYELNILPEDKIGSEPGVQGMERW
jgi:hypothetical protein